MSVSLFNRTGPDEAVYEKRSKNLPSETQLLFIILEKKLSTTHLPLAKLKRTSNFGFVMLNQIQKRPSLRNKINNSVAISSKDCLIFLRKVWSSQLKAS